MVEWSLAQVVEKLVTDVWAWWYLPEQMCGPETIEMSKFLETLLEDRLFSFLFDLGKLDERVVRDLKRVLGQAAIGTTDFPAPSELWTRFKVYVKSRTKPVIWQTTVTHGDAHGDNIFFDPQSLDMWIIDFARTGVRANVFDLAMIESDLKFRGLANFLDLDKAEIEEDFWKQIYKFEAVLASQKLYERPVIPALVLGDDLRPLRTVGKLVIDIRQLACQVLGRSGSFDDYRVVLFLLAFKYMKLSDATPRRRTLAYLAALALVDKAFKPKRPPAGTVTERLSS
jgi:hypothetical protein